jgi:hypothetical protein
MSIILGAQRRLFTVPYLYAADIVFEPAIDKVLCEWGHALFHNAPAPDGTPGKPADAWHVMLNLARLFWPRRRR